MVHSIKLYCMSHMPLGLYVIKELLPQILLIDIDAFIQTYKKNNILN